MRRIKDCTLEIFSQFKKILNIHKKEEKGKRRNKFEQPPEQNDLSQGRDYSKAHTKDV